MEKRSSLLWALGAISMLTITLLLIDGVLSKRKENTEVLRDDATGPSAEDVAMDGIQVIRRSGYLLRGLEMGDYDRGFMDCLNELTEPRAITKEEFEARYRLLCKEGCYKTIVAYDPEEDRVVGTGTLFIEKKFIRGCALKGHIEDVIVLESSRGKGIGLDIVRELISMSKGMGCYKTALVCNPKNIGFYERCGLVEKEREMVIYH